MEQDIRLVYAAASNQVRVNFPAVLVLEERKPPKDLFKRAKSKLEDEQTKGNIEAFVLYESSFNLYWSHLRQRDDIEGKTAHFCIAQGFRSYKDITLKQKSDSREWTISLGANPESLTKIGWPRFLAFVLKNINVEPFSNPRLQMKILEIFWRAVRGEKIQDRQLSLFPLDDELPPLKFSQDKLNGTIVVWISDASLIQSSGHKKLFTQIQNFTEKNKVSLGDYAFLMKECQDQVKELAMMPESYGFGLPLGLPFAIKDLAASALKKDVSAAQGKDIFKNTRTQTKVPEKSQAASNRLIEVEVSEDRLEAVISSSNDAKLQSGSYDQDRKWLDQILAELGIRYGFEMYADKILSLISLGQTLKGQILARGLPCRAGEQIYLHPLFLEKTLGDTDNVIDLRAAQNRRVVEIGDAIAELRYRDGKAGYDVFGKAMYATTKVASYTIEAGPGAERREDGRYYAKIRGVPKLERHLVSCLSVYVHRGDVNLKSGDINFDGTVEVKGSIDNGARVFAKGDIIVRGGIGRAKVSCRGDLSVHKGIVTSREGLVHAGGDVSALFIENSRIIVEGELEVEQSIINSDCKVGGEIIVRSPAKGLIGGGTLVSEEGIRTLDLGFEDGEKTICKVGSDWRLEHRITILRGRETKLKKFVVDRQYELEDFAKKKTPADRVQKVEKRLGKAKKILDRIDKLIESTRNKIRWNDAAILIVKGVADTNIEITIGGRVAPLQKSLKEVFFTAIRYRDQYINSLIYLEQYRKSRMAEGDAI